LSEFNYFDTVISTHTLKHVVDIHLAISELIRLCKNKLIIVLPRQRNINILLIYIFIFPLQIFRFKLMGNKGTCFCLKNEWVYVENYE